MEGAEVGVLKLWLGEPPGARVGVGEVSQRGDPPAGQRFYRTHRF